MSESIRYVERVVTVTAFQPAPTNLEEVAERIVQRGFFGTLKLIAFSIIVVTVLIITGLIGYAIFHAATQIKGRVERKIENQDRFKISTKGVEIKVKERTDEDRNVLAQKISNKIFPGAPTKPKQN